MGDNSAESEIDLIGPLSSPAKWLRDADGHYIGARRLGRESDMAYMSVYIDAFFTLAHGALERYFKGILSAIDGERYSDDQLKSEFRHNLDRLLREVRTHHPDLEGEFFDWIVEVLNAEWAHARYLVNAETAKLVFDAGTFRLKEFDGVVAATRNVLIGHLTPEEVKGSILAALWRSSFPFEALRDAFADGNEHLEEFDGLTPAPGTQDSIE
jgi:hypothetical protein